MISGSIHGSDFSDLSPCRPAPSGASLGHFRSLPSAAMWRSLPWAWTRGPGGGCAGASIMMRWVGATAQGQPAVAVGPGPSQGCFFLMAAFLIPRPRGLGEDPLWPGFLEPAGGRPRRAGGIGHSLWRWRWHRDPGRVARRWHCASLNEPRRREPGRISLRAARCAASSWHCQCQCQWACPAGSGH